MTVADPVRAIADAVLYEGYLLWPYSRSALKNQRRWTFGGVYPPDHSAVHPDDRCRMRTAVPGRGRRGSWSTCACGSCRCSGARYSTHGRPVDEVVVDGTRHQTWEEAVEREVVAPAGVTVPIVVDAGSTEEELGEGARLRRSWDALRGTVAAAVAPAGDGLARVTVEIQNRTPAAGLSRQEALARTFCSTHTVLRAWGGTFVSLTDPPTRRRDAAAACHNEGTWPVLVGDDEATVLSSPIILEDHPQIAPESPGDLFDGGEIDQLLTLSILAMTDEERAEMRASRSARAGDPRAHRGARAGGPHAPARTDERPAGGAGAMSARPGDWAALERPAVDAVEVGGVLVRAGSRVRLHPRGTGDVFDLALDGRDAVVESIEQDVASDDVVVTVTVADDPGRDLGARRQPGHRFFFAPAELEPLPDAAPAPTGTRVLVAGIGNVFLGDDGFGPALAERLSRRALPAGVEVVDYGIRGMDLAYALLDGWDAVVLLDASPRGEPPGTLSVIEPHVDPAARAVETHGMDPVKVLALVQALGGAPPRTLVVACEPVTRMTGEEDEIVAALTEPVRAALDSAELLVVELLDQITTPTSEEARP